MSSNYSYKYLEQIHTAVLLEGSGTDADCPDHPERSCVSSQEHVLLLSFKRIRVLFGSKSRLLVPFLLSIRDGLLLSRLADWRAF